MFKKALLAGVLAASMAVSAGAAAEGVVGAVGVINVALIMHEIPQTKDIQEQLQKEFAPRVQELQALEQEGQKLQQQLQSGAITGQAATDAQRRLAQMQADFNLKNRALQEDSQKRGNEEQGKLNVLVQGAIDDVAKEKSLQLVLKGEAIAYTVNALDISQDVIDRVAKKAGTKAAKK